MAKRNKTAEAIAAGYDYETTKIRDAKTGRVRTSRGNQDAVAKAMLIHVANGGTAKQAAAANGIKMTQGDRNEGLFRMAVGNALRAMVRAGESVKIGSILVKTLKQPIALPKVEALTPRPAKGKAKARSAAAPRRRAKKAAAEAASVPVAA